MGKTAKVYSTNISGQGLVIRAFSMKQVAEHLDVSMYQLRPWISVCGPGMRQPDVDLTEDSTDSENIVK